MIPSRGSIPPNVRNTLKRTSGLSIGTCQQKTEQKSDFKVPKGTRGKEKEKISPEGFVEKLSWLKEHLTELKEVKASTEVIEDVVTQVNKLEDLVGNLLNRK